MSAIKRMSISELARSINGGRSVVGMVLSSASGKYINFRRPVTVKSDKWNNVVWKTSAGNDTYVLSGDVLYFENGSIVEVV